MTIIYNGLGQQIEVSGGTSTAEPQRNDIPCVYLTGTLPTSKDDGNVPFEGYYKSLTDEFDFYATLKVQGDSSQAYPKKNYTIKLFSDSAKSKKLKKDFYEWGERNKFVLKANWIDHLHARNIVTARLWSKMFEARSDYSSLPDVMKGSHHAVDGFPVMVFNNGVYLGLYTWNLPKDAMYDLDEDNPTNYLVQSQTTATIWGSNDSWLDELRDSSNIGSWDTVRSLVISGSDTDFVNMLNTKLDVRSLVDQYIMIVLGCVVDNVAKNQTFYTYDNVKWYGGMYDMDGTWGLHPLAQNWYQYNTAFQNGYASVSDANPNRLYYRLQTLFASDIKSRYGALRSTVLSENAIVGEFESFVKHIPNSLYAEDFASTTGNGNFINIPLHDTNNIQQVRQFVVDRCAYVDSFIESL